MAGPGAVRGSDTRADAAGVKPPRDTRARILAAAVRLFQRGGYAGTGINDVIAASGAPRGSLYHHFPGGKPQLAAEAIAFLAAQVAGLIDRRVEDGVAPGDILRQIAEAMGGWLTQSDWREGCLISVIAQETGPEDALIHQAVLAAYADWSARLIPALQAAGHDEEAAAARADLAIAALEGGLILARVRRSVEPLRNAARLGASTMMRTA